ncbi:hypothetical protein N7495_005163 [Penicillium taxi]|uniref:uncharacterized protein n=1 Tax=Penicillium taxi TaxID=168475 RepID=UPI002545117A|nr:uncharacterized protein N7495_005163 [Penicillium taxi]KAJ5893472.1 hypothetical protein N7495_005163 [Penicillium taxi]
MSLNGLDNPVVLEAYQTALTDAGGWFILHYISRDEVDLLDRGTGGVSEVRNAIDKYEEISPLYGFLQYRRRKVIIRYMPEGLSRLILARSNVQFQSVLDKFSPNDTILPISQASDLSESALSSACLLHTASISMSSSTGSLRRKRLMEITEDAEEGGTKEDVKEKPQLQLQSQFPSVPQSSSDEIRQRSNSQRSEATIVPSVFTPDIERSPSDFRSPPSRASSRPALSRRGSATGSLTGSLSPKSPGADSESRYRSLLDEFPRPSEESRKSSQSARPTIQDLERAAGITPKVKLGPRPSIDQTGKPRTSRSSRNGEQRPVAALPAGIRPSSLRKQKTDTPRPLSQGSAFATMPASRAPPIPLLVPPPSIPISRAPTSPSARSLSALSTSSGLTPEKERLMKALLQRRKAMAKQADERARKQSIAEVEEEPKDEPKESPDLSQSRFSENKENINSVQIPLPDPEKPTPERSELEKPELEKPLDEEITPEQTPELPEPTAEEIVPDLEGASSLLISASTSEPADENTLESVQSETQVIPKDKISEDGGSAIPDQTEAKNSLVPPTSAKFPVPLTKESTEIPEPTPALFEIPVASELLETPPTEAIVERSPEPTTIPTPLVVTPPEEIPSPVSISIDPVPLNETASPAESPIQSHTQSHIGKSDNLPLDQRRNVRVSPIVITDYSDDDNLSDDSLMEELSSATLQEARPVTVKSPTTTDWRGSTRAFSGPQGRPSTANAVTVGRSISGSYTSNDSPAPVLVAKKINVSSGISSRIKALEKFQSREGTPSVVGHNATGLSTSSSFESLRKRASISLHNDNLEASPPGAKQASYSPESFTRAPSVKGGYRPTSSTNRRTNSISVPARIVRDADASLETSESDVHLQASPLTAEDRVHEDVPSQPLTVDTIGVDRSLSISPAGSSRRSSAASPPGSRPSLSASPRSKTDESLPKSPADERTESGTSRTLRRMSSKSIIEDLSSHVKEQSTNVTVGDESVIILPSPSSQHLSEPVDLGEVNVQFPDTLLWKRRAMRVDESGYVVLTPSTQDSSARNMAKRYHLSEFRTPCLPDEDMQELPNSILLDFLDGSTLQCACESRQGQTSTLKALIDAHRAYQS